MRGLCISTATQKMGEGPLPSLCWPAPAACGLSRMLIRARQPRASHVKASLFLKTPIPTGHLILMITGRW